MMLIVLLLLLLLLLLMQMAMMQGQLLQGRRYVTCCCACATSRALALTRARRSTNLTTRLWPWSGLIPMAGVTSAVTAWRSFCTAATSPPV
jgi:hypothetical protein